MPASHLPAVSFLKAPGYEDGHADYSDPIDEQKFVVNEINSLEQLPTWSRTAVIIAYDDSDGFYDHVYSGVTNPSQTAADTLTGAAPVRDRHHATSPTNRVAVATARACRCSSSRRTRRRTS